MPAEREDTTMDTAETVDAATEEAETPTPRVQIVASSPHTAPGTPLGLFGAVTPDEMVARATAHAKALTSVLEDKHLYKTIGRDTDGNERRHVLVDGWTLLGSMVGVFSTTTWTRQVADADGHWHPPLTELQTKTLHSKWCPLDEGRGPAGPDCKTYTKEVPVVVTAGAGGWEARVESHTLDGRRVGAAEAECRWEEPNWADRDSYALRSMAQTRATSKSLRMPLGFIVELAGFNATPAEELPSNVGDAGGDDTYDGPRCPACGSPVWDNRASNDTREEQGKRRQPEFKCKNRTCSAGRDGSGGGEPFFTWDPDWFTVRNYVNAAKARTLTLVEIHRDRWLDRYSTLDTAEGGHPRWETIATALTGDDAQRAGVLYLDVLDRLTGKGHADIDDGTLPMTKETADLIVAWAFTALRRPLEDLNVIPDDELEQPTPPDEGYLPDEDPMGHYGGDYR